MSKPLPLGDHEVEEGTASGFNAREQVIKLVRGNNACLHALQLDSTTKVTDEEIMRALAREIDHLDINMRDRLVPDETIADIQKLYFLDQEEFAVRSSTRREVIWKTLMRIPLCASACLAVAALVLFLTTLQYSRAICALHDFTNSTCNQANTCRLQVVVQVGDTATLLPDWQLPVEAWEASGMVWYSSSGPFKCCNNAGSYVRGDANLSGAGSSCCDFFDGKWKLFCDNFGAEERRPPVPECPASPWSCGAKFETVSGQRRVKEVKPWEDPPSLELFGASLICLSVSGLVRLFPRLTDCAVRVIESVASEIMPRVARAGRRARRRSRRSMDWARRKLRRAKTLPDVVEEVQSEAVSSAGEQQAAPRKKRRIKVKANPQHRPSNVVQVRQKEVSPRQKAGKIGEHEPAERAVELARKDAGADGLELPRQPAHNVSASIPTRVMVKAKPKAANSPGDQPMDVTLLPGTVPVHAAGRVFQPIISPPGHSQAHRDKPGPSAPIGHRAQRRERLPARGAPRAPGAQPSQGLRAAPCQGAHEANGAQQAMQRSQGQVEWMQTAAQLRELSHKQEHGTKPLLPAGSVSDLKAQRSQLHRGRGEAPPGRANAGFQRPPRASQIL